MKLVIKNLFGLKMSKDLRKPVLIYISKAGCPACQDFEPEWKKLIQNPQVKQNFTLVKFICDKQTPPPPNLAEYVGWFPQVLLAGPKSYYRIFTHDDQINQVDYADDYVIKAKQCNSVETSQGTKFAGRAYTENLVLAWLSTVANQVPEFDEMTPPSRYASYF